MPLSANLAEFLGEHVSLMGTWGAQIKTSK